MKNKKEKQTQYVGIIGVMIIVIFAIFMMWFQFFKPPKCSEITKDIELKFIEVQVNKTENFIGFKYLITNNPSNISIIGSKYQPLPFNIGGKEITPKTDVRKFGKEITPEVNDTITINHFITNYLNFSHWNGENYITFKNKDGCIWEESTGVYEEQK